MGNFPHVESLLGHCTSDLSPHVSPDQGPGLGNRWACLGRPRQASATVGPLWDQQLGGQREDRREAPHHRGGTATRPRMPLALGCPPHRRACCRTRHLSGPAPDHPGQPGCRRLRQLRRPPGLRLAGALGVAPPPPAAGNGRLARVRPHRGVRTPLDRTWPCTRPLVTRPRGPRRLVSHTAARVARRFPWRRGRPCCRGSRRGGRSSRAASRRRRGIPRARDQVWTCSSHSSAASRLSATPPPCRPGHQRTTPGIRCQARSPTGRARRPRRA